MSWLELRAPHASLTAPSAGRPGPRAGTWPSGGGGVPVAALGVGSGVGLTGLGGLTGAAVAAARVAPVRVLVVAEPFRVAVLTPAGDRLAALLAARSPDWQLVERASLLDQPAPGCGAAGAARPPRGWRPPGGVEGLLLRALAPAALGGGVAVASVRLAPVHDGHRRAARDPGDGDGPAGRILSAGLDAVAGGLSQLMGAPSPSATPAARPDAAALLAQRVGAERAAALAVAVHLQVCWYADTSAAADAGLSAVAGCLGLPLRRMRTRRAGGAGVDGGVDGGGGVGGRPGRRPAPVTPAELAALLEPPTGGLAHLSVAPPHHGEPDAPPGPEDLTLARSSAGRPVALHPLELASHAYVLGPSGTGKTTLLARLVCALAQRQIACVVLDPHGDLARQVLAALPDPVLPRTWLLDLADPLRLPGLNPLWLERVGSPPQLAIAQATRAAAVAGVFADLWELGRATTPNLLHFLQAALSALVTAGDGCLADLPRFLTDAAFRAQVVARAGDPRVSARWQEFAELPAAERGRAVRAILNKAGEFDRNPVLGTVFGDRGPGLRLEEVMDRGRLLVVSLPRGLVPEGTVELVGSVLMTLLHQAALAREARPPGQRPLCVAVIDEFQEFALRAFPAIVTSTRKYGLGLVVANQNFSRVSAVSHDVLSTLLANVGTLVSFRPGAPDAAVLAPYVAPLSAGELLALPARGLVWRRSGGAAAHSVLTAQSLPPLPERRTPGEVDALLPLLRGAIPGRPADLSAPARPRRPRW